MRSEQVPNKVNQGTHGTQMKCLDFAVELSAKVQVLGPSRNSSDLASFGVTFSLYSVNVRGWAWRMDMGM